MFRGEFKKLNYKGIPNEYTVGDTVLFEGNIYQNVIPTKKSPYESSNSWKYFGSGNLYSSENPPINPKIGQIWEKNGVLYTYYYDGNNFSWVNF